MLLRACLALGCLLPATGCAAVYVDSKVNHGCDLRHLHPIQDPDPRVVDLCNGVPQRVKDHTHVYFVNGIDPFYVGNFNGLARQVQALRFCHCSCGQMHHTGHFRRDIRKVKQADPDARIVLVGYSAGANCVRDLAHELNRDGVPVDLLVYIGGDTVKNGPYSRPENTDRLLNLTGHGLIFGGRDLYFWGDEIDGATNYRQDARHILLPSQAPTVESLLLQLVAVCQRPAGVVHGTSMTTGGG
jgi:hypothetical protein